MGEVKVCVMYGLTYLLDRRLTVTNAGPSSVVGPPTLLFKTKLTFGSLGQRSVVLIEPDPPVTLSRPLLFLMPHQLAKDQYSCKKCPLPRPPTGRPASPRAQISGPSVAEGPGDRFHLTGYRAKRPPPILNPVTNALKVTSEPMAEKKNATFGIFITIIIFFMNTSHGGYTILNIATDSVLTTLRKSQA
ncbi:hypothetical protein J6590_065227 [Homalodisca vitripennis]|nr:hypothetical protein J6590_065227 [Homalodisca vitripennis]